MSNHTKERFNTVVDDSTRATLEVTVRVYGRRVKLFKSVCSRSDKEDANLDAKVDWEDFKDIHQDLAKSAVATITTVEVLT